MKRFAIIFTAALLAACGGGGGDAPISSALAQVQPQAAQVEDPNARPYRCKLVVHGDSITSGFYTDISTYPYKESQLAVPIVEQLRRFFNIEAVDRSVPGQNLQNVMDGFTHPNPAIGYVAPFALQDRQGAQVVVVGNGIIDSWLTVIEGRWSLSESVDLHQRLDAARKVIEREGALMVVTGFARQHVFPDGSVQHFITPAMIAERQKFDDTARRFAETYNLPFADFGAATFNGASDISDTVHPTPAYSYRLAQRLAGAVADACTRQGRTIG